jgi:hypothetical protein
MGGGRESCGVWGAHIYAAERGRDRLHGRAEKNTQKWQ